MLNLAYLSILLALASAVYASYDAQVNDANSCDFSGTAERKYTLKDGDLEEQEASQCLIKDSANAQDICGAMQWACYDQNYADVSTCILNRLQKTATVSKLQSLKP